MLLKICRSHTEGFASFTVQFFLKNHMQVQQGIKKKKHELAAASSFPELDRIVQKIVNGKSTFSDLVISPLMYIQLQPRCPMHFSHLNEGPIFFWSYQAHSTGESHLSQSSSDTHNKQRETGSTKSEDLLNLCQVQIGLLLYF